MNVLVLNCGSSTVKFLKGIIDVEFGIDLKRKPFGGER
jgi:hypothetical protein